jgi:hypothetical protein
MTAYLFIPPNATPEHPAPAIVTTHGWFVTKEYQDINYIELARRGYVVIANDMYGHGDSDRFSGVDWNQRGSGQYDAVELLSKLPYVDKTKIGITGHSYGGRACYASIMADNTAPRPLISAVLIAGNEPYQMVSIERGVRATEELPYGTDSSGNWNDIYGSRTAGFIAGKYDEIFYRTFAEDGSHTIPRDYIKTADPQTFLNFGRPSGTPGAETRMADTWYTQNVNGKQVSRVFYTPPLIHPAEVFSRTAARETVEFFDKAFGAPKSIPATNQVWQIKAFFGLLGIAGFFIFALSFAILMLFTPAFASLRAKQILSLEGPRSRTGLFWFWGGLVVIATFTLVSFLPTITWAGFNTPNYPIFTQGVSLAMAGWSFICGIFLIVVMIFFYNFYMKKEGRGLASIGVKIPLPVLGKTILLAVITVAVTYLWVFFSVYFFKVDFRFWLFSIRAFRPAFLYYALPYIPFFLTLYVAHSVLINSFNYFKLGNREWINIAILTAANTLATLVYVAIQYITLYATGELATFNLFYFGNVGGSWLIQSIIPCIASALIARKIFSVTGNPYIGGIINALLVTFITCTTQLTMITSFPYTLV